MFPPLSGWGPPVENTVTPVGDWITIEIVSPFFPLVLLSATVIVNMYPSTPFQRPVPVHVPELPIELSVSTDVLWNRLLLSVASLPGAGPLTMSKGVVSSKCTPLSHDVRSEAVP